MTSAFLKTMYCFGITQNLIPQPHFMARLKTRYLWSVLFMNRHVDLAEDWIPFQKYINSALRLSELIRGKFGMLADGPEPLVLSYEKIMQSFGFSTSHHESRRPNYWNGEKWIEEKATLSVLILDQSYVIAEAFKASAI